MSSEISEQERVSRKRFLQSIAAAGAVGTVGLALSGPLIHPVQATVADADPASYIITNESGTFNAYDGSTGTVPAGPPPFSGTDAATVIQNAINALTTGGLIFIKNGSYPIKTALNAIGDVVLEGESMTQTRLVWTSPYNQPVGYLGVVNINSGAQVTNLTIDGSSQTIDGILQFDSANIGNIERIQILNASSFCIEARGRRLSIKRCFWNQSLVNVNHGATDVLVEGCFAEDDGNTTKVGIVNTAENGTERVIVNNNFAHLRYSYGSTVYRLIDFLTPRCQANHNIILSDVFQSSGNVVGIRLGHGLGDAYNIANGNIVWNLVQSMVADELPGQGITGDTSVGNNYIRVLNNIFYQGGFDFGENVFAIVEGNLFFGNNGQTGIRGNSLHATFRNNQFVNKTISGVAFAGHYTTWDGNIFVDYQATPTMVEAFDLQSPNLANNVFTNNRIKIANMFGGTGSLAATSIVRNNPGFNPQGIASIPTPSSGSPYTNNDNVPEAIYIFGGRLVSPFVKKNNIIIFNATPCTVWLEPGESVTVYYNNTPTMLKDRK